MKNSGNSIGVKYGLVAGLLSILYTLVLYLVDPTNVVSFTAFVIYIFILSAMVMAGLKFKKLLGGYATFKEVLKVTFIVAIMWSICVNAFTHVLYKYIDPELSEVLREQTIERTVSWMEKFGAPDSEIDKVIDQMEEQDFGPKTILGLAMSIIIGFAIAALISLIIRKNPPELIEPATAGESTENPE